MSAPQSRCTAPQALVVDRAGEGSQQAITYVRFIRIAAFLCLSSNARRVESSLIASAAPQVVVDARQSRGAGTCLTFVDAAVQFRTFGDTWSARRFCGWCADHHLKLLALTQLKTSADPLFRCRGTERSRHPRRTGTHRRSSPASRPVGLACGCASNLEESNIRASSLGVRPSMPESKTSATYSR